MIIDLLKKLGSIPPHQRHSETSRASAIAASNQFGEKTAALLIKFEETVEGLTDNEGQDRFGIDGNSYRPMRVSLAKLGLVEDSGERRKTSANRNAVVWKITQEGLRVCK